MVRKRDYHDNIFSEAPLNVGETNSRLFSLCRDI